MRAHAKKITKKKQEMETRLPKPTPSGSALDADSAAIARRFFAALDLLREEGAVR